MSRKQVNNIMSSVCKKEKETGGEERMREREGEKNVEQGESVRS